MWQILYGSLLFICTISNTTAEIPTTPFTKLESLSNTRRNGRWSYLHAMEEDLLHRAWEEQEQPCLHQLIKVIRNVQNSTLWATWIWDSMQFPVGQLYGSRTHLGNYDQCMDFPGEDHPEFRTQYCLAEMDLSHLDPEITNVDLFGSVEKHLRFKTQHGLRYNTLIWGLCVPVVCKSESITKFADAMFRMTHLGQMEKQVNITVNSDFCQLAGEHEEVGTAEYIFMLFLIILVIWALLCTIYINLNRFESKSIVSKFATAFDIPSNTQWLMKEEQSVKSMLGIRLLSTYVIVFGHLWLAKNMFGVSNAGQVDKKFDNFISTTKFNVDIVVDIFFMMSGLLLTKALMANISKTFNPLTVITKRYIRFVRSMLLIILILPIVLMRGDPAPLVKRYFQIEVETCAENWWKSLLMLGNYGDTENMCYPVLWSLACDFHLFVIGVIIFWIYRKNRAAGIKAYVICAVASIVVPILYGYVYNSPVVFAFDFRVSDNLRKFPVGDPAYVRTHLRAGPYFVGMAFGYLMAVFNPNKHRNIISKRSSMLVFILFLAMFVSLSLLSATYHWPQHGALEGAMFAVIRRNAFAALVGLLIIICEYGTLPIVSSVLGWPGLVPLSKLSYGVYLTHFSVLFRLVSRTRVPLRSDIMEDVYTTNGLLVVTMTMSLLMYLFWEAPVANLIEIFLKRYHGKTQQNGSVENNGKLDTAAVTEESKDDKLSKKFN